MVISRYLYAAALGLCFLSYLALGQWLSWVLLCCLLVFPWLSLALSLRAIVRFRAEPSCPRQIPAGSWGELCLLGSCPYPVPPFRGKLRIENMLTGEHRLYRPDAGIPTRHCGCCCVTVEKGRVCDYLGLFSFPVRSKGSGFFLILPRPLPVDPLPDFLQTKANPDPGEPEPRPYRPGDPVKRIHRKLTLKTDTLILLYPTHQNQPVVLTLTLAGSADTLDRNLGQFIWMGRELMKKNIPFVLRAYTGEGLLSLPVSSDRELETVLFRLLCIRAPESLHPEDAFAGEENCQFGVSYG